MNGHPAARRRARGFTLIEMVIAIAIAAVLSSIALPSFSAALQKSRRTEALVALMQVQIAQERWRAGHSRYGTLEEIGVSAATSGGHYVVSIENADENGYDALAVATGTQARDADCRVLRLRMQGATVLRASGSDGSLSNAPVQNRRCWMS